MPPSLSARVRRSDPPQASTVRRIAVALSAVALASLPLVASAQAIVTEGDVARMALEAPEWTGAADARRRAAEARARTAGLRPDPELEAAHEGGEGLFGDGSETSVQLAYPLDFGGVRSRERLAGRARLEGDLAQLDERAAERAFEARRFYRRAVAAGRREEALARRLHQYERAVVVTRYRYNEGDVPQFELGRIELERDAARAEMQQAAAERASNWGQLAALVGPVTPPTDAVGPAPLPPLDDYLAAVERAPVVRRAAAEARTAEAEAEVAQRRARTPETSLVGGLRTTDDGMDRTVGLIVGARLSLPMFGGGRVRVEAARAEASAARADQRLLLEQRQRGVTAAHAAVARLIGAVEGRAGLTAGGQRVFGPAEAAFIAGEIDLTELLNIYRGGSEAELALVALELQAAEARIDLDALVGRTTP